jgi:cytochrome b561
MLMAVDSKQIDAPTEAYTPVARFLHWLTAALVLILIVVGVIIANTGDWPGKMVVYDLHKSTGIIVLPIVLFRLFYRLTHPPAPLPPHMPPTMQLAAHANHWTLYALLITQPIVGWIATSAYRAPIPVYFLFEMPPIWREDRAFSERMFTVHAVIATLLAIAAAVHISAALYHHFGRKDEVLMRMVRG